VAAKRFAASILAALSWSATARRGASLELTCRAAAGVNYRLQASTNLITWRDIFLFQNTEAVTALTGLDASTFPNRFYRVASP